MKLGDNVYGGTNLCPPEDEPRPPPRGQATPKKHAFSGVFLVIFKEELVSQFESDSPTEYCFGNIRAISKTSRDRILNFDLVLIL